MKMTIFQRVAIGHFLILLLFLVLGVYIAVTLNSLNRDILAVTRINSTAVTRVDALMDDLLSQRALEQKYLITGDKDYADAFDTVCRTFQSELSDLQHSIQTDDISIPFERLEKTCDSYQQLFKEEVAQTVADDARRHIYEKRRTVLLSSL
jgi:CHASE3 domain sensor protein